MKKENNDHNILSLDNREVLSRNQYDEMVTKAVFILLALMKVKSQKLKTCMTGAKSTDAFDAQQEFRMLEIIEQEYKFFEENLDYALTNQITRDQILRKSREVILKYGLHEYGAAGQA